MRKSAVGTGRSSLSSAPLRIRNEGGPSKLPTKRTSGSNRSSLLPGSKRTSSDASSRASLGYGAGMSRPSFGGNSKISRLSLGQNKKRHSSGLGMRSRGEVLKDPRPVSDKSYLHRCMKILAEFLTERNYNQNISLKILQSPTSKDFYRMFEFLYRHLNPLYKMDKKPEEEIPKLMKQIGYPFMISKTSMFAIGSPHTWPHLLAMLIFLVDLIKHSLNMTQDVDSRLFPPQEEGDFDCVPEDKIKFNYTDQTYAAFMSGEDCYDEFDEELNKILKERVCGVAGGIDTLLEMNQRLSQELELLDPEKDRLIPLQEQREVLNTDVETFVRFLNDVEIHNKRLLKQYTEVQEDCTSLGSELSEIQHKTDSLQTIYKQQDLTPSDVERIRLTGQELKRHIEELERENESVDSAIWNEEVVVAKDREKTESVCHEYNKIASNLKLIPSTAEFAQGMEFELRSNIVYLSGSHMDTIRIALTDFKTQITDHNYSLVMEKIKQTDNLETMRDLILEVEGEISDFQNKIKHTEEELESHKQIFRRDQETIQQDIATIQQEIRQLHTSSQMSIQDARAELRELQKVAEQQHLDCKNEEKQAVEFLWKVTDHTVKIKSDSRMLIEKNLNTMKLYKKRMEKLAATWSECGLPQWQQQFSTNSLSK